MLLAISYSIFISMALGLGVGVVRLLLSDHGILLVSAIWAVLGVGVGVTTWALNEREKDALTPRLAKSK